MRDKIMGTLIVIAFFILLGFVIHQLLQFATIMHKEEMKQIKENETQKPKEQVK